MYIIKDILNKENYLRNTLNQTIELLTFTRETYEYYQMQIFRVNTDEEIIVYVGEYKNIE